MTYIHKLCISLLSTNILFAQNLTISDPPIATNSITNTFPANKFTFKKFYTSYDNIYNISQQIAKYLFNHSTENDIQVWQYEKKRSLNPLKPLTQYIAIGHIDKNKNTNLIHYFFSLREKPYNKLKGFKKGFANYFYIKKDAKVKFLYPYKKYNHAPWAMIAGNLFYMSIWVKLEKNGIPSNNPDNFLTTLSTQVHNNDNVEVLLTDGNKIIASRINGKVTFRPD